MAGIVGVVGSTDVRASMDDALRMLRHQHAARERVLHDAQGCILGVSYRDGTPPMHALDGAGGLSVIVVGSPIEPDRGRYATISDVLDVVHRAGALGLTRLDGGFTAAVVDSHRGRLTIVNDRMATVPLHYAAVGGSFAFAPEAKAVLRLAGRPPRLDPTAALEFLAMGHAMGSRTLFEDVHLLPPASVVSIDLKTADATFDRYWDLQFRPRSKLREADAADELFERLVATVSASTSSSEKFNLLLTGGFDSRILLGLMREAGRDPDLALTWGATQDLERSDVTVARTLAADYGVPFLYLPYTADNFVGAARDWMVVSELASDNLGNFAAGAGFLHQGEAEAAFMVNGDHLFGAGGLPPTREAAVAFATRLPVDGSLPVGLKDIIAPSSCDDATEVVRTGIRQVVDSFRGSDSPKDLQDYLAYRIGVARWLNAPTFFREPVVQPSRPYLHASVVDLVAEMHEGLRVDRRLQVMMLRRRLPELVRAPIATNNSLIDWGQAFSRPGPTGDYFTELVLAPNIHSSPLGDVVSQDGIARALAAFGASTSNALQRRPWYAELAPRVRRAAGRSKWGHAAIRVAQGAASRALGPQRSGAGASRVLMRVALLNLFLDVMHGGGFEGTSGEGAEERPGRRSTDVQS